MGEIKMARTIGAGNSSGDITTDNITDAGETGKYLLKSATPEDAREALELGDSATKTVGTETGNVMPVGAFGLGVGPQHKTDAWGTTVEFFRVNNTSANRPGNNAYGGARLPIDGAPTAGYLMIGGDHSVWVGLSTTKAKGVTWTRAFTMAYRPAATKTELGFVKQAALVADPATDDVATLKATIIALLAAMKTAGIMATTMAIPGVNSKEDQ